MYPKLEGRFAQVAGINFEFDPNEPPSQRIDPKSIKIKNAQLDLDKVKIINFEHIFTIDMICYSLLMFMISV